ncbi:sensor of ECF-type sigma factor [Seonamhaeicola algicola]|uniref:Sensor of ECF-type sigma factor n=1 Tax=Seonamhaeicola algicola TaxID=1719036 RepID=A0A5C7ANX4_9FLAO|nr:sensor of ECF-type sigma factor [Seonamhaeicola algicola]TXE10041.1 sensor of ECF-type sigma factor [Seonamhaeicola algicola]
MKKHIITLLICLITLTINAQHNREKIQSLKVAFITEQLDLTKKEAQKFWPVYNEFDKKSATIKYHEMRTLRQEIKDNVSTLTNEKALDLMTKIESIESRLCALRINFSEKIKTILPPKKVIKLKVAEEDFKRKMLDRYRKHRGGER